MTAAGWAALAITIFGAVSYGAGSVLQAVGARRSTGTVRTLGHPLYLLGVGCDLLAWAGSMFALRELAVYQVQSVLAGSLAVTVVFARLFLRSRLRGRDVAAVMVTIAALTIMAMSAGEQEHVAASFGLRLGLCAAALATAVLGWGATKVSSPGVVAALAGLAFGGAALCSRSITLPTERWSDAALALVTEPLAAALLIFAAAGMLLYTNALANGQVGPVTAVLWIGEVVAPSAVGIALLGDTVRAGWDVPATVACLITIGAAVVLAGAPATDATAQPQPAQPQLPQRAVPAQPQYAVPAQPARPAELRPRSHVLARHRAPLPSRAALLWPGPALAEPAPVQPYADQWAVTFRWWGPTFADRLAGTIRWWGPSTNPQPIWKPPDRTGWIPTVHSVAEPGWSYAYRPRHASGEPVWHASGEPALSTQIAPR